MDGSQKLPQRLLATIAERRARGASIEALALAVAAWLRWQLGRDDAGASFTVDDPLAALTAERLRGAADPGAQVAALLSIDAVFPRSLAADTGFAAILTRHVERLSTLGAAATVETFGVSA
jgi:fructuronate reductase